MSGNVYSTVQVFHFDAPGIRVNNLDAGPQSYANELARYIRCPSTIRARTFDHWGRGPTIDEAREMRARHEQAAAHFRDAWNKLGHSDRDQWVKPLPAIAAPPVELDLPEPTIVLPSEIIAAVERAFKLRPNTIVGRSRIKKISGPRNLVAWVLRQRGNSFGKIGKLLGGRDHTTAINAVRQFEATSTPELRDFAARFVGATA